MNLSKVIQPEVRIQDSCLIEFSEETGVTPDNLIFEIDQYLPHDTIVNFLTDYSNTNDLEYSGDPSLVDFCTESGSKSVDLLKELNRWYPEPKKAEMIESFKKDWDL